MASASVRRSTAPPSRKAGHVGPLSGHASRITDLRTLSWSSGAAHPPGGPTRSSRIRKGTPRPRMWRGGRRQGKEPGRRRGGGAGKGEAAQGGEARGREGGGGAAAGGPKPRADADGLGLGVPAAAAVCAAAGAEGTRDGHGVDGGGSGELARYVKWAGKTRGRREKRGTPPFSDLVGRAGRPRERGPEMDEGRWRRMLGAALPGVRLDCPQAKGKKPRVQMLRELLQREGRYGGDA